MHLAQQVSPQYCQPHPQARHSCSSPSQAECSLSRPSSARATGEPTHQHSKAQSQSRTDSSQPRPPSDTKKPGPSKGPDMMTLLRMPAHLADTTGEHMHLQVDSDPHNAFSSPSLYSGTWHTSMKKHKGKEGLPAC